MNRLSVIACILAVGLSAHAQMDESDELEGLIPAPEQTQTATQATTQVTVQSAAKPAMNTPEHKRAVEMYSEPILGVHAAPSVAEDLSSDAMATRELPKRAKNSGAVSISPAMSWPGMPLAPKAQVSVVETAPRVSYLEVLEGLRIPRTEFTSQSTFVKDGALKSKTLK